MSVPAKISAKSTSAKSTSAADSSLQSRDRGAMLIVTMGVLTLLAVLGTTFVSLMRLEKKAAQNYVDAQVIDLINDTALERAISDLRGSINHLSYTSYRRTPWLFRLRGEDELAHGRVGIEDSSVGSWTEFVDIDGKKFHRYKIKIIDAAAQININGRQDSLARMLDNLALAITQSTRIRGKKYYPLYTGPREQGNRLKGTDILEFRNRREGRRFRSKSQLREIIGEENYETIKDFITVHSWEDPYTYAATDGLDEVQDLELNLGSAGRALGGGNQIGHPEVESLSPRIGEEPRSPININTAPEEVLVACLMGIGGRRPFPFSNLQYGTIDEGAAIQGQRVPGQEELSNALPRGIWVYMRRLPYDKALGIARKIIQARKNPSRPFMAWSSGQRTQPGFAEFVNELDENSFPPANSAQMIDPKNVNDRRVQSQILGGNEISTMWRNGHQQHERAERIRTGLPYHVNNAFYFELCKASLIANFNPNTRVNRYNPNAAAWTAVDKQDLVTLDEQDQRTPRHGYTTEFCFDTMGVYEVTTLGEIARKGGIDDRGEEIFEPLYRKKMRAVVKVFDVIRHTNQFHFEKTFRTAGMTSKQNRRNVVTWPEPMEALTDAVTFGSKQDGRVELAGLADARRMEMPPNQREQAAGANQAIQFAHTFQDRNDQSYNQLRRLAAKPTRGLNEASEYTRQLQAVLGGSFSRKSKFFRQHYTREDLQKIMGALGGRVALPFEPRIDIDVLGTDLRPDGLHTSLFTMGHTGARILHLVAHNRIGQGSSQNAVGNPAIVGAGLETNLSGNVPYYNGGIAFWVKFEFDGNDPVFSGLIGCTSITEDVAVSQDQYEGSEGTQFFIFKNTKGQLRVVRMYYHQAFPAASGGGGDGGDGGGEGGLAQLWPRLGDLINEAGGSEQLQRYLDERKPIARSDLIIDVSPFRAREWHHIAVDWNDSNPGQTLQLYIDFEKVQGAGPYIPQSEITDLPTAWVRLNHRRPIDGLFVGGFLRHQARADAGVFKWFTSSSSLSQGRGIQPVEPSVKRILANATIDELITYTGTFQGVRRYFAPSGSPGYYTNQPGEYTNMMPIPLPPEVDHVVMRSFDWTSYYPSYYAGNITSRTVFPVSTDPITCEVRVGRSSPAPFPEVWRKRNVESDVAGKPVMRSQGGKGLVGRNAELVYRFRIPPGKVRSGPLAGGSVHTPVIDDVTATYYLPDPKILYQEEVD